MIRSTAERVEQLADVPFDFDPAPGVSDYSLFIDDESAAVDAHVFLAVKFLLFQNTVLLAERSIGIGKKWKG